MDRKDEMKKIVKEKYTEIVKKSAADASRPCCCSGAKSDIYTTFSPDYSQKDGYVKDADLGLGCGMPTDALALKPGATVVDLGSGAGNDVFIARRIVGAAGKIIGIDMTQAMIERARENAAKLGYENVEFRPGDIEHLPVEGNTVDVVVSNCVINLVPDKLTAYREIYRILKPGGRFAVSDIVVNGKLSAGIRAAAALYAGCVAGAISKEDYTGIIAEAGFTGISIKKEIEYTLPVAVLLQHLAQAEIDDFKQSGVQIKSITVYGEKPSAGA